MRADLKGDLGKPRSGVPHPFSFQGRRRAQFLHPGTPTSLRVYAGAKAGTQSCWRRASFSGSVGRCKHAVLTRSARVGVVRPRTGVSGVVDGVPHT